MTGSTGLSRRSVTFLAQAPSRAIGGTRYAGRWLLSLRRANAGNPALTRFPHQQSQALQCSRQELSQRLQPGEGRSRARRGLPGRQGSRQGTSYRGFRTERSRHHAYCDHRSRGRSQDSGSSEASAEARARCNQPSARRLLQRRRDHDEDGAGHSSHRGERRSRAAGAGCRWLKRESRSPTSRCSPCLSGWSATA